MWVFCCGLILLPIAVVSAALGLFIGIDVVGQRISKVFADLGGQAVLLILGAGMLMLRSQPYGAGRLVAQLPL